MIILIFLIFSNIVLIKQ
ncbi:EP402R [African swine fever virus]|uniref:EP402R n=1 Tax=African swine fever virus TaxID=10497 RepID=A0A8A1V5X6_ASF|nr:EP402R [African swine fever virus]